MRQPSGAYQRAPEKLVAALARAGNLDAFSALVARRQSWLRNLMRRLCGDAALADDLSQKVFVRAWRDIAQLRRAEQFGPWLQQVAINVWRQQVRRGTLPGPYADPGVERAQTPTPGIARDLDRALAQLTAEQRLCVVLSYHEGMSHSEIATRTGLPAGTVKSHIRRGTASLRILLEAYHTEKETPE